MADIREAIDFHAGVSKSTFAHRSLTFETGFWNHDERHTLDPRELPASKFHLMEGKWKTHNSGICKWPDNGSDYKV